MDFISISQPFSVISKIEIRYVAFFVFVDALYGDFDSCCVLYPFDSLIHQTMPTSIGFFALGKKFMGNFMDTSSSSSTKKCGWGIFWMLSGSCWPWRRGSYSILVLEILREIWVIRLDGNELWLKAQFVDFWKYSENSTKPDDRSESRGISLPVLIITKQKD